MKNRLIVDIYWCALSATWCCETFTIIHAQNIVVQKNFVRAEGDAGASPASPWTRHCFSDSLNNALMCKNINSFWKTWKSKF